MVVRQEKSASFRVISLGNTNEDSHIIKILTCINTSGLLSERIADYGSMLLGRSFFI